MFTKGGSDTYDASTWSHTHSSFHHLQFKIYIKGYLWLMSSSVPSYIFVFWLCPHSLSCTHPFHPLPQLFTSFLSSSSFISINSCLVLLFYLLSPLIFPYPPPPQLPCPRLPCSSLVCPLPVTFALHFSLFPSFTFPLLLSLTFLLL